MSPFWRSVAIVCVNAQKGVWHYMGIMRDGSMTYEFHTRLYNSIGIIIFSLRREGRIASAEPVCSCALSFVQFAHETSGAARTRSSLRPLPGERGKRDARLGHSLPRERARTSQTSCPATGLAFGEPDDRLRRGIQYAAACRLAHTCLWNTGSSGPGFAEASQYGRFSEGGKPDDDSGDPFGS
jgi:hypothetical protein